MKLVVILLVMMVWPSCANADWDILAVHTPTENEDSPIIDVTSCSDGLVVTCFGEGNLRGILDAKLCYKGECVNATLMTISIECGYNHSHSMMFSLPLTQVQIRGVWGSDGEQSFVVQCNRSK